MDNEAVREELKGHMRALLEDEDIKQDLTQLWDAQERAAEHDDNAVKAAIERAWDEDLGPKVESHVQSIVDRIMADAQYTPPDGAAGAGLKQWPPSDEFLRRAPQTDEERNMQRLHDDLYLLWQFGLAAKNGRRDVAYAAKLQERYLDICGAPDSMKALVTGTSGGAAEWVPTILSADIHDAITDKLGHAALIPTFTMQGKNVDVPSISGNADVYIKTEATAVTEDASITSGAISFEAVPLATRRRWSEELDADSILSVVGLLRARLGAGIARDIDRAIDNGDTATTHHDSDVTSSSDPRKAWIGLREKALTNTGANADLSTFDLDTLLAIPGAMGLYAQPENMRLIVPNKVYWTKLPTLATTAGDPVFLPGQVGTSSGSVVTGMTGVSIMGIPIILSTLKREDLNASGVYDGTTTTKTTVEFVNVEAWLFGLRKDTQIVIGYDEEGGYYKIVATWRGDFQHMEGTNLTTAMGYNIA